MHADKAWIIMLQCLFVSAVFLHQGHVELHLKVEYLVSSELMLCCHHGGPVPQLKKLQSWLAQAEAFS